MNTFRAKQTSLAFCLVLSITSCKTTNALAFSSSRVRNGGLIQSGASMVPSAFHKIGNPVPSNPITSLRAVSDDKKDEEIERLLSMAAKLRAEASSLEAEKAKEKANAIEKAFRQFDTNQDEEIDLNEFKIGLEKVLKTELSEKRVEELMKDLDSSGDGKLQLDEFVTIDQFRNRLETLSQEEKRRASEAQQLAKKQEQEAALAQARLDILNDREPTVSDRAFSVLPYFFPLLDGLQYGRFLLGGQEDGSNPFIVGLAIVYSLYRTIPFSGFIAFFALNILSNNPSINRLIRYNMQQAIFLDIALFFPGLVTGLLGLGLTKANIELPTSVVQLGTDAIFVTLLIALAYCSVSSLLGKTPDKLPLISGAVTKRMPSVDMFTVDKDGNIRMKEDDEKEEEDKK